MSELTNEELVKRIRDFLKGIGIDTREAELHDACILPGLDIVGTTILIDKNRMKYPGDLLHEAGHIAVTDPNERELIGSEKMSAEWPSDGDEIVAILWSYAAALHLGLPLEVVFHADGYKNEGEWIIDELEKGNFIGLPLLEWMGLCNGPEAAKMNDEPEFPNMKKWLR